MSGRKSFRACSIAARRARASSRSISTTCAGAGAAIVAGEKPVGTIGSSADGHGLALLRLDRAADALDAGMPLTAGGLALPHRRTGRVRSTPKKTVA